MKMFGVARHNRADNYGFNFEYLAADQRFRATTAYAQPADKAALRDWMELQNEQILWFTDTMEAAEILAKELARKFPGNEYVAFKSEFVFKAPPGEVTKSQFTSKGLLPA